MEHVSSQNDQKSWAKLCFNAKDSHSSSDLDSRGQQPASVASEAAGLEESQRHFAGANFSTVTERGGGPLVEDQCCASPMLSCSPRLCAIALVFLHSQSRTEHRSGRAVWGFTITDSLLSHEHSLITLCRHVRVLSSKATEEVCGTPLTPCKASSSRALWGCQLPCTASSDRSTLWIFPQTSKSLLCHPLCGPAGLQGAPFVSLRWCGCRPHILAILAGLCLWWQPLWSGPANHSVPGALTSQDKGRDT